MMSIESTNITLVSTSFITLMLLLLLPLSMNSYPNCRSPSVRYAGWSWPVVPVQALTSSSDLSDLSDDPFSIDAHFRVCINDSRP